MSSRMRADLEPWRRRLWALVRETPQLDWLLLTKRPQAVRRLAPWREAWPRNVWMGATVESQEWADRRVPLLLQADAAVRFLSCEPLLGRIQLGAWAAAGTPAMGHRRRRERAAGPPDQAGLGHRPAGSVPRARHPVSFQAVGGNGGLAHQGRSSWSAWARRAAGGWCKAPYATHSRRPGERRPPQNERPNGSQCRSGFRMPPSPSGGAEGERPGADLSRSAKSIAAGNKLREV